MEAVGRFQLLGHPQHRAVQSLAICVAKNKDVILVKPNVASDNN